MNAEAIAKGALAWYDSKDEGRNRPKGEKTTSSLLTGIIIKSKCHRGMDVILSGLRPVPINR
jgi:hypothetical protein